MAMRNIQTGEVAPEHKLGKDDGREIVQRVEGWELCHADGTDLTEGEQDCVSHDDDGNYVIG